MKNGGIYIKLIGLALILYLLGIQLAEMDWQQLVFQFTLDFENKRFYLLFLVISFMPLNYWLEVLKWKILTKSFIPGSFKSFWRSVLSGVALANSTPLRLGDYAGRVLHLSPDQASKGLVANLISSIIQNVVNLYIGFILLYFYLDALMSYSFQIGYLASTLFLLILFIVALFLVNRQAILKWGQKTYLHKIWKRLSVHFDILKLYTIKLVAQVAWLSILRYMVYLLQYYIILSFFGAELELFSAITGIAVVYLIQSAIPLPALLGFVARAEIALVVWGAYGVNPMIILCASYGLWVVNQLIPALIGMIYLGQLKLSGNNSVPQQLKSWLN